MTKDEALKLALRALRFAGDDGYQNEVIQDAITAIKQARALDKMAENARELGLDYEPVPENFIDALKFDVAMRDAAPVQEPVQEPVAWMLGNSTFFDVVSHDERLLKASKNDIPLYTTPPAAQRQWVGLTDDEIESLDCVYLNWLDYEEVEIKGEKEFARAIEAKLKEKNT